MKQLAIPLAKVGLDAMLYPYQRVGAAYLRERTAALLGDQMGLGKTVQAIAAIPETEGAVVVAPASLVANWKRELQRFRPELSVHDELEPLPGPGQVAVTAYSRLPPCHLEGSRLGVSMRSNLLVTTPTMQPTLKVGDILTSIEGVLLASPADLARELATREPYQNVVAEVSRGGSLVQVVLILLPPHDESPRWTGEKPKLPFTLILDEAQYVKAPKSRRTQRARALGGVASRVWALTGTPLPNRPPELWAVLQACKWSASKVFGSWDEMVDLFGGKKVTQYVGRNKSVTAYEWGEPKPAASERLGSFMLRRTRAEVLPDLPTKTYQVHEVTVSKKGLLGQDFRYLDGWSDEKVQRESEEDGSLFSIRCELAEAKHVALGELLDFFADENEPVVVFSCYRAIVDHLGRLPGWAKVTGDCSTRERDLAVRAFQDGKLAGIAGTLTAMGVGLTLTRAAHCIFVDRAFTPAENLQGEDRLCRIGQDRGVVVHLLQSKHPVDQRVEAILKKKSRMLESVDLLG